MKEEKKAFSQPKIEIITFLTEDILVVSGLPPVEDDDTPSDNMDSNGWL